MQSSKWKITPTVTSPKVNDTSPSDMKTLLGREKKLESLKDSILLQYSFVQERMGKLMSARASVEKNHAAMQRQLDELHPFTWNNQIKKQKALLKVTQGKRFVSEKAKEYRRIIVETQRLKARKELLHRLIAKLHSYQKIISGAILLLPSDYVKTHKDQSLEGLMIRFQSLFYLNDILFHTMEEQSLEFRKLRDVEIDLYHQKQVGILEMCAEVKRLMDINHSVESTLNAQEREYFNKFDILREKIHKFGVVLLSIDNVTNKCILHYKLPRAADIHPIKCHTLKTMEAEMKVSKINDFIEHNMQILELVNEAEPINDLFLKIIQRRSTKTS